MVSDADDGILQDLVSLSVLLLLYIQVMFVYVSSISCTSLNRTMKPDLNVKVPRLKISSGLAFQCNKRGCIVIKLTTNRDHVFLAMFFIKLDGSKKGMARSRRV